MTSIWYRLCTICLQNPCSLYKLELGYQRCAWMACMYITRRRAMEKATTAMIEANMPVACKHHLHSGGAFDVRFTHKRTKCRTEVWKRCVKQPGRCYWRLACDFPILQVNACVEHNLKTHCK